MEAPYLYSGLEASLYDRLDELSDFEDLAFYEWFVGAADGPTLDVGCGTGRIMLPLLEKGREVVGLDSSEEMLAVCRASLERRGLTAELRSGDMRNFDLGAGRFGTVMIPGYSAQLLVEEADFRSCLACCRKHLAIGGQLILPTYMPWEMIWEGRKSKPLEERRALDDAATGERLRAFQGWTLQMDQQLLRLLNRYEKRDRKGNLLAEEEKTMTLRWYLPHEMMQLLGEAGFEDVSMYGDFDFEPPDEDSESIIYVARV